MGVSAITTARRGGRGARDRILRAATELFYRDGIHTTGVARLAEVAEVSTRTFYQHFPSKDALVAAYLHRLDTESPPTPTAQLGRTDLDPRARLIALFSAPPADEAAHPIRGCPFHNAAVEFAGADSALTELIAGYKRQFQRRIVATAAEAGATDPDTLGRQLALLFEGATALSTSLDELGPLNDARAVAELLIDAAVRPA